MKWKQALQQMKPYKPGRSIEDAQKEYQLQSIVKLASNENPYGSSPKVEQLIQQNQTHFELYPEGTAPGLREKLAKKHNVQPGNLLFGNGSDELISVISRALLQKGTNVLAATPTFPQYGHNAKIEGAEVRQLPLIDGQHDLDGFLKQIDEQTAIVWICNPNNPTGDLIPSVEIEQFLQQVPTDVLVVLDEAYYEYVTAPEFTDSINFLKTYPNVIVLRTFSKAYGLASFRVGYGVASEAIVTELNKVRNPFNNGSLAVAAASAALDDLEFIEKCRKLNAEQRELYNQFAGQHQLHMYQSQTNFVLVEVPVDADEATEYFLRHGYIVRSGNLLGTPGYVRVTIGSAEQNKGFLQVFEQLIIDKGR